MTYDIERGGMSYMRPGKVKEVGLDIVADIVGSFFIAVGVYNFAVASGFPVAGISGIAIIFYHFFGIPIGVMTAVLNIPIIKDFFAEILKDDGDFYDFYGRCRSDVSGI